jgi:hypothetical protein
LPAHLIFFGPGIDVKLKEKKEKIFAPCPCRKIQLPIFLPLLYILKDVGMLNEASP